MKRFILGSILGVAVSTLRAQPGQTLFEFPAAGALSSYGMRAVALLSCALALFHARSLFHERRQNTVLLLGITIGFVLHGLFILPLQSSPCRILMVAAAIAPPLLARLLRRGPRTPAPEETGLGTLALVGVALCAIGVTVALEGTARQARLLGAGASLDDTIFGGVFLALATFGGVAFARTLAQIRDDWGRGRALETALVLSAGLTLLSQRALETLSTNGGLRQFMRRYGEETVNYGMLGYDGILAVAVWIAPAFALGTAIACARRASELTAIAGGAAIGCLVILIPGEPSNVALIERGILVASVGALAAASLRPKRSDGLPITIALAAVAVGLVSPFVTEPRATMIHGPWKRFPVAPSMAFETTIGLVTVAPGGADVDVVGINGVQMTPDLAQAGADRNQIVASVELLDEMTVATGFNVLLIGQLTPGRALTLTDLGARRIDRTAAWHQTMPRLEERLFTERGHDLPPGEILSPSDARQRFGSFDLVLALPVKGPAPLLPTDFDAEAEGSPLVVLWVDGGYGIHRRNLGRPVLLSSGGVQDLAVGLVYPNLEEESGLASIFAPSIGFDRLTTWRDGQLRSPRRHQLGLTRFTQALAASNADGNLGKFARGLTLHHAAQQRSSIFETPEQTIETSDEALGELFDALGPGSAPGAFARETWNGISIALIGKRDILSVYRYLEPLAERWGPWPELQIALAIADMESLEPADALARLQDFERAPVSLKARALDLSARAQAELGDHAGASRTLRQLGELAPSHWQRRQLGIEATLAEEPDGPEILAEILLEDPDDLDVRALVEQGVAPQPPGAGASGHLNHDH